MCFIVTFCKCFFQKYFGHMVDDVESQTIFSTLSTTVQCFSHKCICRTAEVDHLRIISSWVFNELLMDKVWWLECIDVADVFWNMHRKHPQNTEINHLNENIWISRSFMMCLGDIIFILGLVLPRDLANFKKF